MDMHSHYNEPRGNHGRDSAHSQSRGLLAWHKGVAVAWQVYNRDLKPQGQTGKADGVPAWSLVDAFARPDGGFTVVY
jgi:hypothetical protein